MPNKRPRVSDPSKPKPKPSRPQPDLSVWRILRPFLIEKISTEDVFSNPFRTERERIRHNSDLYKDVTIAEAFARAYQKEISNPLIGNETPQDVVVGSILPLKITAISKQDGVIFDSGVHKDCFMTRNNLVRFGKFEKYLPAQPVPVRVVEVTPQGVQVDIFGPMLEEFILPRTKNPWIQNTLEDYIPVRVKNLKLVKGGYLGKAVIPNISEFVGEDFEIDAFIPGSQIVQNTTDNFEQFEGQDVDTFITAWIPKPGNNGMSLVCSAKNLIKHRGNLNLCKIHSMWCETGPEWDDFVKKEWSGKITGVINSAKKCGVFVEIPELEITGMIHTKPSELVNFPAGQDILVHLVDFDEDKYYNEAVGQLQRKPPFEIERGAIKKVNIKPILKVAGNI